MIDAKYIIVMIYRHVRDPVQFFERKFCAGPFRWFFTRLNGEKTDMSDLCRDQQGRFAPGNSGGPGRPKLSYEQECSKTLQDAVSQDDWLEIIHKTVQDAKKGDHRSRQWLANYLLGRPRERDAVKLRLLDPVNDCFQSLLR